MKYTVYFTVILLLLSGCREDSPEAPPTPGDQEQTTRQETPTDAPAQGIEGLWEVESQISEHGDLENKSSLLVLENGTFLCTAYEAESGLVTRTHGGPYTFDGETLHLTFTFASESIEQVIGRTYTFTIRFEDEKLHLSGYPDGVKLEEVWRRVQPAP
jgi:hypothetical protein